MLELIIMAMETFVLLVVKMIGPKNIWTRAVDYFGRLTQPKAMTPENSWTKRERYSWERDEHVSTHYYRNVCTNEERPLTESQYNDTSYTLNT